MTDSDRRVDIKIDQQQNLGDYLGLTKELDRGLVTVKTSYVEKQKTKNMRRFNYGAQEQCSLCNSISKTTVKFFLQ